MEVIEFESREALADALAHAVSSDLRDALSVSDQARALLRVSGNLLPARFRRMVRCRRRPRAREAAPEVSANSSCF